MSFVERNDFFEQNDKAQLVEFSKDSIPVIHAEKAFPSSLIVTHDFEKSGNFISFCAGRYF